MLSWPSAMSSALTDLGRRLRPTHERSQGRSFSGRPFVALLLSLHPSPSSLLLHHDFTNNQPGSLTTFRTLDLARSTFTGADPFQVASLSQSYEQNGHLRPCADGQPTCHSQYSLLSTRPSPSYFSVTVWAPLKLRAPFLPPHARGSLVGVCRWTVIGPESWWEALVGLLRGCTTREARGAGFPRCVSRRRSWSRS